MKCFEDGIEFELPGFCRMGNAISVRLIDCTHPCAVTSKHSIRSIRRHTVMSARKGERRPREERRNVTELPRFNALASMQVVRRRVYRPSREI